MSARKIIAWPLGEAPRPELISTGVEAGLKDLQRLVGGYIETVVQLEPDLVVFGDDEGLLKLRPLRRVEVPGGGGFHCFGDVVVCRYDEQGSPVDVSEADLALVQSLTEVVAVPRG